MVPWALLSFVLQRPTPAFEAGRATPDEAQDDRNNEAGGVTKIRTELIQAAKLSNRWGPSHCRGGPSKLYCLRRRSGPLAGARSAPAGSADTGVFTCAHAALTCCG
jgi:hypothetical protein